MKKSVFLIFSGMAILLSGCTGSSYVVFNTTGIGSSLVNTGTTSPLRNEEDRGLCLSISPRSSLNIDVEGILDYVQAAPSMDMVDEQAEHLNPWIRWHYSF